MPKVPAPIDPLSVRSALRAVRFAQPLERSDLVHLALVTRRLRESGAPDTPQTRSWELGKLLDDLVCDALARYRMPSPPPATARPDPLLDHERRLMREHFAAQDAEREAWAALHFRYLGVDRRPVAEAAEDVGVTIKTFERRLNTGHKLMAQVIYAKELEAIRDLTTWSGAPVASRIQAPNVTARLDDGDAHPVANDVMESLLATVRSTDAVCELSAEAVKAVICHPAADLVEYRLGRVAEWSQQRFRLDSRFVALSLLLDRGEEAASGRWRAEDKRFESLHQVLEEVDATAVVVLGPPGSGKSTLLRRLEWDSSVDGLLTTSAPITFLVPLSQHLSEAGAAPPPREWLLERWESRFPAMPPLATLLADGRMLLLLDGLNEIPHVTFREYRERVAAWKRFAVELASERRGNRIVFSCRSLDYSTPLSTPELRVPQVQIAPMSDAQVQQYLSLYHPALAADLWEKLAGTPQLELLRTAYFLQLLVDQVRNSGDLPSGRAHLFTGFVRESLQREVERDNPLFLPGYLLAERDYKRVVVARTWRTPWELPERGALFPALARLAFGMQGVQVGSESYEVRVPYDDAADFLADEQAADILDAGTDLAILDEDRDRDEVLFRHQLLQEYFAARALAARPDPNLVCVTWGAAAQDPSVEEIIADLDAGEPLPPLPGTGWEETMLLAAAMNPNPAACLREMARVNLSLAGRAACDPELRPLLSHDVLDDLARALVTRSRDPSADLRDRISCGYAAGDLGDPRLATHSRHGCTYHLPPFVKVASGEYPIGSDDAIRWTVRDREVMTTAHIPAHTVAITSFWIGAFPVTNAEWARFVAAGGYEDDRWWTTPDAVRWLHGELTSDLAIENNRSWRKRFQADPALFERLVALDRFASSGDVERWRSWMAMDEANFETAVQRYGRPKRETKPRYWSDERYNRPAQPVVGICWYEARAYCAWLSELSGHAVRLPTEAEWEAAARGRDGRDYPNGRAFDIHSGNTVVSHVRRPSPIGVFVDGDTPDGIADLCGNVFDWTSSAFGAGDPEDERPQFGYPYDHTDGREDPSASPGVRRVVRGGGWNDDLGPGRCTYRDHSYPGFAYDYIGMRLASETDPTHSTQE